MTYANVALVVERGMCPDWMVIISVDQEVADNNTAPFSKAAVHL